MGLKKIKVRVKAGRGDGEDHLWANFLDEAYDSFKAAYDGADAADQKEVVDKLNSVDDDCFGTEVVSNKAAATSMWADLDDGQHCKAIDILFGRNGETGLLEEEAE